MLTDDEKFLIGCALGDGHMNRRKAFANVCSIQMTHTRPQLEYLEWKVEKARPILKSKGKINSCINNCGIEYFRWEAGFSSFVHLYELLYKDNKKTFSFELLKDLGPQELALLWCDDGSIVKLFRDKTDPRTGKKYPNLLQETQGSLALYEPKEEANVVASWIRDLTGEKPSCAKHKKTGLYYLRFNKRQLVALVSCIQEYTPNCMSNKLDLALIPISERAQVLKQRAIRRQERAAT
jgi:hypothetical protein